MNDSIEVLYVDVNSKSAELSATSLERENNRISVETAPTTDQELDELAEEEFDCVVSDYDMAEQNGIKFFRTIQEQFPDIPLILYIDEGSQKVAIEAISADVTDYLQKETGTDQYTVLANRITNAVESSQSQKKLVERNEELRRYKQMVNSMQEAACVYDESGRFVIVNEYLANWYDTTREELQGQQSNLISLIREQTDDSDPYQALLDRQLDQLSGEIEAEFPGHGTGVVEYQLTPLITDDEIEAIVGIARDITEQEERQQKLQQERDRLDEFAGVVSHDLQNPLNVAQGRLQLLKETSDSEHLAPIERALDRMDDIIENVLSLAREGEGVGEMETVVLGEQIENAWKITADQAAQAELQYADDESAALKIKADADRLCELFENLFSNAIEHGGDEVTVTVGTTTNGFYIRDNGPGISEDERTDVFTAGYSTTTGGTGFGLNIVQQIAEAHDWNIQLAESADEGARFQITGVEIITE